MVKKICQFHAVLICFVMASQFTYGQGTLFSDKALFQSAITVTYLEDFETLGPGTNVFSGPFTLPSGLVVSSPTNDLFTAGPQQSTNPSQAIGSNSPPDDSLDFDLSGSFSAFGADFFQNDGGGSQFPTSISYELSFFENGAMVDSVVALVAPDGGSFVGYISDVNFDFVSAISIEPSFEVADDVVVGFAVPEPSSFAMFALLTMLFGLATRRNLSDRQKR